MSTQRQHQICLGHLITDNQLIQLIRGPLLMLHSTCIHTHTVYTLYTPYSAYLVCNFFLRDEQWYEWWMMGIHTYTQCIHTYIHMHTVHSACSYTHTHTHTLQCIHTYTQCIHTYIHSACLTVHTHINTHMHHTNLTQHTHIHILIQALQCIHTYTHACKLIIHSTHTHTYLVERTSWWCPWHPDSHSLWGWWDWVAGRSCSLSLAGSL